MSAFKPEFEITKSDKQLVMRLPEGGLPFMSFIYSDAFDSNDLTFFGHGHWNYLIMDENQGLVFEINRMALENVLRDGGEIVCPLVCPLSEWVDYDEIERERNGETE